MTPYLNHLKISKDKKNYIHLASLCMLVVRKKRARVRRSIEQ